MKFTRRTGSLSVILAVALVSLVGLAATAQTAPPETQSTAKKPQTPIQVWADDVWEAAMKRDLDALDRHFQNIPTESADVDGVARFRESFKLHLNNDEKARTKRDEARAKALGEMHEHLAANNLPKALRAAVTVQTLSDDLNGAFADPDVMKIVEWAKEQIPQVEKELDWLLAQELLFYLRTLYEDTGKFDEYKSYKEQLDAVNRRVSLLAQYAPKRLHELRSRRAERLGEKPLGEFKPNPENKDWKSKVRTITPEMLKGALKTAANEHIEARHWRPLLLGGLEELRLLATTASLDESFPKLAEPALVEKWVACIDRETASINEAKEADIDSWRLTTLLGELIKQSDESVQLDKGVIYHEFGDGATFALDEYSEIIWPDKLPRFKQATEGAFVGVGILIRHNDAQEIMVVNPLEGTPAYFGGVKPNDAIAEVDGLSTVGWTLNDAVDKITGQPATKVTLGMKREGVDGLLPITLQRDVIKLRSVMGWWKKGLAPDGAPQWDWFVDPVGRIAYIKLTQFTEDSFDDLRAAWDEITAVCGRPAGLVLDLRYNPGGLLNSAISISNLFVKDGLIVSGEDKDGKQPPNFVPQRADPTKAKWADVPTVVLINQGSASASEIVSGCLQAHGAAVIVGERSFGKGSVQTVHQIASNARFKLTTQYYRLPPGLGQTKGRLVHKRIGATVWGVDPDVLVKMTPAQVTESLELRQKADIIPKDEEGNLQPNSPDRPDVSKLVAEGLDPQLETALLILQARALGNDGTDAQHARKDP